MANGQPMSLWFATVFSLECGESATREVGFVSNQGTNTFHQKDID
jgi:hypothetical protein